jgi:patatin-like phospholipase/acyl hydrolase
MKIRNADFIQIEETLKTMRDVAFRLNGELGYCHTKDPAPFEQKLNNTLRILYNYAPDEFLLDVALKVIEDKTSEDRAKKVLIENYGVNERKAEIIVEQAWEKFLHDEGEMY